MKNYAAMTAAQRTSYNEGLLDAIDELLQIRDKERIGGLPWLAFEAAHRSLAKFRNKQIGSVK